MALTTLRYEIQARVPHGRYFLYTLMYCTYNIGLLKLQYITKCLISFFNNYKNNFLL